MEEDCPGLLTALWNALYKDDWGHDVDYVVMYNSSIVCILSFSESLSRA